jgi:hypothetical protein
MTYRELMAGRYVAAMIVGDGDRRRVSNTLRQAFTGREREKLHAIALEALAARERRLS